MKAMLTIEDATRATGCRTLLGLEIRELLALYLGRIAGPASARNVTKERRLRLSGHIEVNVDLLPNFVARVVDLNALVVFTLKLHSEDLFRGRCLRRDILASGFG